MVLPRANWGGYPATPQRLHTVGWTRDFEGDFMRQFPADMPILAHGNGRSQGDVGLNSQGLLLDMRACNHILAFDVTTGILRVEAGATLHDILQFAVPRGWTLPVVPGTRFVTVGGAIANDIHGKNHHRDGPEKKGWGGSFGHHVVAIDLWRSDTGVHTVRPGERLFHATLGGLGLTGVVLRAALRLRPITSGLLARQVMPVGSLAHFFELMAAQSLRHEFAIAWLDLGAPDAHLGRGYVEFADWLDGTQEELVAPPLPMISVPFPLPVNMINPLTVKAFNAMWRWKHRARADVVRYDRFFWPLDGVGNWRYVYGPARFLQCQLVVPHHVAPEVLPVIIRLIRNQGRPTFLNTLKFMGDHTAVGWCSFPRVGVTLAVDMLMEGTPTLHLMRQVEELVLQAGGAIYPAKDAALSPRGFQRMYPHWRALSELKDPRIASDFWARVSAMDLGF